MLVVRDVTVSFDAIAVLDRATLSVGDGEIVALLGPSGSGKSTLLRVIAGLVVPDAGRVELDGRDVTRLATHRRGVGMVFQDEQLFPHRDVAANVAFGMRMQRVSAGDRARRVDELLDMVGLPGFGSRRVTELSGGEAKRIALARSLAPSPRVLLLDEPLTGLDRELHDRLTLELAQILRRAATTCLLVTHDRHEAMAIADRVVALGDLGPGSIARPPDVGPDGPADGAGHDLGARRHGAGEGFSVVELDAAVTHPLRASVLRRGTPSSAVVLDGDADADTLHLGVRTADGNVVAVSTWLRRKAPDVIDRSDLQAESSAPVGPASAVQLRAMATSPDVQGRGIGARLLGAGVERAFAAGADVVWANARDTALGFYRRHGFVVVEPGFVDATTALPHHVVVRRRP